MFTPSNHKTMHPLQQVFSIKSSSPSSSISSMKLKRIIHTLIVSHMCRIIRALSKVKQVVVEILRDNSTLIHDFPYTTSSSSHRNRHNKNNRRNKNIILGSFRLHYNWCSSKSSHVLPVPQRVYEGLQQNVTNNVVVDGEDVNNCPHESQLAGYLRWLEEKKVLEEEDGAKDDDKDDMNEIDVLAEMFIANCHEKFKLEKQDSDRKFQEMLARSI